MNYTKTLFSWVYIAVWTSSWWAAARWGNLDVDTAETAYFLLWVLAGGLSIIPVSFLFCFIEQHWNDK
mgnify:CR=1 FL=1